MICKEEFIWIYNDLDYGGYLCFSDMFLEILRFILRYKEFLKKGGICIEKSYLNFRLEL